MLLFVGLLDVCHKRIIHPVEIDTYIETKLTLTAFIGDPDMANTAAVNNVNKSADEQFGINDVETVSAEAVINVQLTTVNNNMNITPPDDAQMTANIDKLSGKRQNWEVNEYLRSNQKLFELLSECHVFFQSINGTTEQIVNQRKSFDRVAKKMGFTFSNSNHYIYRVVSVIFGSKSYSRRISKYATVIKVAIAENISPDQLVQFITDRGGIEEITTKKPDGLSRHDKGKAILYRTPLTTINDDELLDEFVLDDYVDSVLFLGTYDQTSDDFNIIKVIQKPGALKSVFESMASEATDAEVAQKKAALINDDKDDDSDHESSDDELEGF